MKIAVAVDESCRRDLTHARAQAARLRRSGFGVVGMSRKLDRAERDSANLLHAVGPGAWRFARRLARRSGTPIVYDHPPGAAPPGRLKWADAVIASAYLDAKALERHLKRGSEVVIVPPDPPPRTAAVRPFPRRRLGSGRRMIALQEAADLSRDQAVALIHAVSPLPDIDLVFLGGDRWQDKADLLAIVDEAQIRDRVHLIGDVPSTRRADYLDQADVGLALTDGARGRDRLPAADLFDMLGVPFIASTGRLDPASGNGIASDGDPLALRAAIVAAGERERLPAREDGAQILEALVVDISTPNGRAETAEVAALESPRESKRRVKSAVVKDAATRLLDQAKVLRDDGDRQGALRLYSQVADGSYPAHAVADAAVGLAHLSARAEARAAVDRIMATAERPPLVTARAGEAAAALGDLTRARSSADEVLADASASDSALSTVIRVLEQAGEPRAALSVARGVGDEPRVARIEGTLASYDPAWLPAGGGTMAPLRPHADRSFTLLETSLPHVRSGYTYRAQTLLRAQRRAGIEPTALTRLGFPATRGLVSPPTEEIDGIAHHRPRLPGVKHYSSVPVPEQLEANVRWAAALGREIRPGGIIATTPHLNGLVGLALRNELGVPVVYDVRGFPEMTWAVRDGGGDSEAFALRRIAETRCMREADLVTTLSETMRQHIVSRGIPTEKVFVLPHAVDTDAFVPIERDRGLLESLGLSGREVIGYVSSLVAYEGVETLLKAIALAREETPSIAGLIVGGGELLPSLEAQARRLGLDGHVVFTGRVDAHEVSRYYSLMDVFVCPRQDHEVTRYVTPLKPFEAMAAGRCVVASDLPALREAVHDGECGALFPAGDAGELAGTVLDLLDRPERRLSLEGAARNHAVTNHGFDTLCARLERVWSELRLRS